jgi:hypothetical protein
VSRSARRHRAGSGPLGVGGTDLASTLPGGSGQGFGAGGAGCVANNNANAGGGSSAGAWIVKEYA